MSDGIQFDPRRAYQHQVDVIVESGVLKFGRHDPFAGQ